MNNSQYFQTTSLSYQLKAAERELASFRSGDAYVYCTPVKFTVWPDCRPPARHFPGYITVNPGGLQYKTPCKLRVCDPRTKPYHQEAPERAR